jgi:serine/threonine-protein kinase
MQPRDEMVGATVLGRYRIVARLAKGGMGVVYLARAEGAAGFAKPVVVKRVLPDLTGDEKMARLFVREARILSNLQHPNIVSVIDFGEEDGAYIMVLDYVRAYHLGLWLDHRRSRGERLPVEGVLHIVIKVLDALEYAHGLTLPDGKPLDIVHADISPANVLVDTDGQVKLLDFGIARMAGEATQSTDSSSIRGKFSYLPIEALDGSPPTVATDIYACGVVLYELLAGDNPFTGTDETRTIARVISHEPPPVSQLRPDVSPELDAIVARGISKDRVKRFASAKEFASELRRVRRVAEDEAARSLAALAKTDYAAMPSKPGASLSELEESWRNPPTGTASVPKMRLSAAALSSPEIVVAPPAPAPPPPPRRSPLVLVAVVVGVVAVVGVSVALALHFGRRSESEEPKYVLIERNATSANAASTGASSTTAEASAAPAISAASPSEPAEPRVASRDAGARAPKPAGDPLSAALAKNQPEIEACFRDKAANVTGTPEVSVRFTIDQEGTVQRAELSPAELASAPLGQCILGVARRTRFPAQSGPATFRIPLRARKVP